MKRRRASIFLSYGSPDKPFVRKLAADLKSIGIKVWFDEWEIKVGDSISGLVNAAIKESSYFGAVISDDSIKRPWVQKELQVAMHLQVEGVLKILPVLITDSNDIPPFVRELRYADFSGSYRLGLRDLVLAVDPSKAVDVGILEADISVSEKMSWFESEFSLASLKATATLEPRQYSRNKKARLGLFAEIVEEIYEEWRHLRTTEDYSLRGVASPKSGAAYVRDHLRARSIDPFKELYNPLIGGSASVNFKKLFLSGDRECELILFRETKEKYEAIMRLDPLFAVASENLKLSFLERSLMNFERFCLFEGLRRKETISREEDPGSSTS